MISILFVSEITNILHFGYVKLHQIPIFSLVQYWERYTTSISLTMKKNVTRKIRFE